MSGYPPSYPPSSRYNPPHLHRVDRVGKPSLAQLSIQVRWPDMESQPPVPGEFLYLYLEDWGVWETSPTPRISTGWTGWGSLPLYLTVTYEAGARTGYLDVWWSDDQCTEYLLGWYKDGGLTDQREEATLVKFAGISSSLEWTLPAHPATLPRLEEARELAVSKER